MVGLRTKETERTVNPLDKMMTAAQVARRRFKSTLPRKIENRRLSALEAIGETAKLLDHFQSFVAEQGQDPEVTIHAALAFCLPESDPATLGGTILIPAPSKIGSFCDEVMKLDRPLFLGVVFIQLDPETENPNYKWTSFCAQFMGGPESESRLHYAQKTLLTKIASTAKAVNKRRKGPQ